MTAVILTAVAFAWAAPGDGRVATDSSSLSSAELQAMIGNLPPDIQRTIVSDQKDFLSLLVQVLREPKSLTVLVDKEHALPEGFVPPDLVRLSSYHLALSNNELELRQAVMPELLAMVSAARRNGITLLLSSTYRSYAVQKWVYAREVADYGQEAADRESARPGTSQHQLGTAIDFGSITDAFDATPAAVWLSKHAWQYGFSLSYPKGYEAVTGYRYEGWHYRYIGRAAALLAKEYFDGVQQYELLFLHDNAKELSLLLGAPPSG